MSGCGVVDMKGSVACLVVFAERAAATVALDITVFLYDQEEAGSHPSGMHRLTRSRPELLRADAGVVLKPIGGWVEAGCQGNLRMRATYLGRPAPTALPWRGINAVHRAAAALARVAAHDPGVAVVGGLEHRQLLVAVAVHRGTEGNVLPDRCELVVHSRYAPSRPVEAAHRELADLLADVDELVVTPNSPRAAPGVGHPRPAPLYAAAASRVRRKLGWTDVGRLGELGMPAVTFGPGDPELAHAPSVTVTVTELVWVHDRLVELAS